VHTVQREHSTCDSTGRTCLQRNSVSCRYPLPVRYTIEGVEGRTKEGIIKIRYVFYQKIEDEGIDTLFDVCMYLVGTSTVHNPSGCDSNFYRGGKSQQNISDYVPRTYR
jgi:hypothetical protein